MFLGSSSIRMWKLEKHFPKLGAVNRGFGGSQISDSIQHFGRLVMPHRPRLIVFYAGDNDIAAGKSPEQVAKDYQTFVAMVRVLMPGYDQSRFCVQSLPMTSNSGGRRGTSLSFTALPHVP